MKTPAKIPTALEAKLAERQARNAAAALPHPSASIPLPPGWDMVRSTDDGFVAKCTPRKLLVIVSDSIEDDGRAWRHVSVSIPGAKRVPNYEEMALVKRIFVGDDREAYSVWPRKSHHVNIHAFCLHLWCPLDGPALPDFTAGTGSI